MRDDSVTVTAPARLHLGFLDPSGRSGRRFGGIGLAIDEPCTRLTLTRASRDEAKGPEAERAASHLRDLRKELGIDRRHALRVEKAIPPHAGLGSGTQLALAVSMALRELEGLSQNVSGDAWQLGRGERSGLGVAFATGGGIAVDGGRGAGRQPAPIVARLPFPEDWRIILVVDRTIEGFHGHAEREAFADLPGFPEEDVAEICRLVLLRALPAVAEHDISTFGAAIAAIQQKVGSHFAPAQGGGVFISSRVAAALIALAKSGAHGIGQSSWGPTGFCFAASQAEAEHLVAEGEALGIGVDFRIVRGRNKGASTEHNRARLRTAFR